eukprot:TRINITY_DN3642_c0_g1_i1.p1 TRINITY_DN3642_c0_g1~~TRINITY_DN3642_c0_g1_i1.p1  ORF type:complete len:288 (-),score=71.91 TRINITY_DN3642_c0_g1_i1:49-912(-)
MSSRFARLFPEALRFQRHPLQLFSELEPSEYRHAFPRGGFPTLFSDLFEASEACQEPRCGHQGPAEEESGHLRRHLNMRQQEERHRMRERFMIQEQKRAKELLEQQKRKQQQREFELIGQERRERQARVHTPQELQSLSKAENARDIRRNTFSTKQIDDLRKRMMEQLVGSSATNSRSYGDIDQAPNKSEKRHQKPSAEILDGTNETVINIDMPGIKKENVRFKLDGAILRVTALREKSHPQGYHVLFSETNYGEVDMSFKLPRGTTEDAIDGQLIDGVLRISISKI